VLHADDVDGDGQVAFGAYQSEKHNSDSGGDNNMWPLLSFLMVAIVLLGVAFILVIHHYRYLHFKSNYSAPKS